MRIVHVSDCYPPRLGGIEVQVQNLACRQAAAGDQVRVVTTVAAGRSPGCAVPDVPVWRPDARGGTGSICYHWSRRGRDAVIAGGADVVHVHTSTFSPLAFLTARDSCRAGLPTVVTMHSLWDSSIPVFRAADRLVGWSEWPVTWSAVSEAAAEPLRAVLGAKADVSVLPNAVDPSQWQVSPLPRQRNHVHLVAVMRLAPRKRPRHLLAVLQAVRKRVSADVTLTAEIIGEGPQRRVLERQLRRNRMADWVRLTGRYNHGQIRNALARADLFVSTARLESFGIAVLEARCAGVPVIARSGTGVSEFITHGREGLLVDSDADMIDGLTALIASPAVRARMVAYNRAVPPVATWENALDRCQRLYDLAGGVSGAATRAAAVPVSV